MEVLKSNQHLNMLLKLTRRVSRCGRSSNRVPYNSCCSIPCSQLLWVVGLSRFPPQLVPFGGCWLLVGVRLCSLAVPCPISVAYGAVSFHPSSQRLSVSCLCYVLTSGQLSEQILNAWYIRSTTSTVIL